MHLKGIGLCSKGISTMATIRSFPIPTDTTHLPAHRHRSFTYTTLTAQHIAVLSHWILPHSYVQLTPVTAGLSYIWVSPRHSMAMWQWQGPRQRRNLAKFALEDSLHADKLSRTFCPVRPGQYKPPSVWSESCDWKKVTKHFQTSRAIGRSTCGCFSLALTVQAIWW